MKATIRNELDMKRAGKLIRDMLLSGKAIDLTWIEHKASRSHDQNAALWGVAYPPIMEFCGLRGEKEKEQLHHDFLCDYFGCVETKALGHTHRKPKRTTTTNEDGKRDLIDKSRMADFYSFIQQKAADFGVFVPDPDPFYGLSGKSQMQHYGQDKAA